MIDLHVLQGPGAALVLACAFVAGLVDAMVGGGGLVLVPALFSAYPQVPPATLLGTGKLTGILSTGSAAARYAVSVSIPWRIVLPGAGLAFLAALGGAAAVSFVPADLFRPLVPVMMLAVLAYTLTRRDLGRNHAPHAIIGRRRALAATLFAAIGFYDGFFGPGAGSFLMFMFIRVFGFDFLHAAASARVVNVAANLAALATFGARGQVLVTLGLAMAVCAIVGAQIGTRLAVAGGSTLVRRVFIGIVSALIAKTALDAWRSWPG